MSQRMVFANFWSSGEEGLTLTELLIVILIIGVLAGIAVLSFSGSRSSAIQDSCKNSYGAIALALSNYKSDTPSATQASLNAVIRNPGDIPDTYLTKSLLATNSFSFLIAWGPSLRETITVLNSRNETMTGTAQQACESLR